MSMDFNDERRNWENFFYETIFQWYPKYQKFKENNVAQSLFYELTDPEKIYFMIKASKSDKPALSACIEEIEEKYESQNQLDLQDHFTRQFVGSMVRLILEPFGYEPIKQKELSKSKYFTSAQVYRKAEKEERELLDVGKKFWIEKKQH